MIRAVYLSAYREKSRRFSLAIAILSASLSSTLGLAGCSFHRPQQPETTMKTGDGVEYLAHEIIVKLQAGSSLADLTKSVGAVGGKVLPEAGTMVGPMASPSSPSVRFTALLMPTIIR